MNTFAVLIYFFQLLLNNLRHAKNRHIHVLKERNVKETKSATMNIFSNFFIFFLNHL